MSSVEMEEVDLSKVTSNFLLRQHVDRVSNVIRIGKQLRHTYSDTQREVLEESHQDPALDDLNLAFAISKMSEEAILGWEESLKLILQAIDDKCEDLMSYEDIKTITMFITFLTQLKARSRRHLDNFLTAALDGEWVDGMVLAKGNETEFRTIDHCSDSTRSEFGLGPKNN